MKIVEKCPVMKNRKENSCASRSLPQMFLLFKNRNIEFAASLSDNQIHLKVRKTALKMLFRDLQLEQIIIRL